MSDYYMPQVIFSFVIAVTGSLIALMQTRDALKKPENERNNLIILAAISLGGMGIWSMHFTGMLALQMHEMNMNYNWPLTFLSLFVAIGAVYVGLRIMTFGQTFSLPKLVMAGVLVGFGVVAMHYTGMFAMEMQADVKWDWTIIAISIAIALIASIVALWLVTHVSKIWQIGISAIVMGVAVCGMHYTGMEAADYVYNAALPPVEAMSSPELLVLGVYVIDALVVIAGVTSIMLGSNERENI